MNPSRSPRHTLSLTPAFVPFHRGSLCERPQIFFEDDDGANNSGGDNNSQSQNSQSQNNSQQSQKKSKKSAVAELLAEIRDSKRVGGESDKANEVLAGLVITERDRNAELALNAVSPAERANLKAANDLLQAYGAKDFTELKKLLDDGKKAIGERDSLQKSTTMREACEVAGLDYEDFSSRKDVDNWSYETKTEDQNGKAVKVAYVTFTDDKGKEVTKVLADYAAAKFPTLAKANNTQRPQGKLIKQGINGSQSETTAQRIRREEEERNKVRGARKPDGDNAERPRRTVFDRRRR